MKASSSPAKNGYIATLDVGSLPVLVHWTFPITGLVITLMLGRFSLERFVPVLSAYVLLILIHELGHATFAALAHKKVHAITITGAGGWCVADRPETFLGALLYYAGGLLFQLLAFAATLFILSISGSSYSVWGSSFAFVFIYYNAIIFFLNALPMANTDGAKIWSLVRSHET